MTMEQKFNALATYVLADNPVQKEVARKILSSAMQEPTTDSNATTDIEDVIHNYLMELGADPSLLGYKYVVFGIQSIVERPNLIDNLSYGFYPLIAAKFDTTPARAERAIRHVIETIWETGKMNALQNFGYTIKVMSYKPTNGNFMARSALIVRSRLK